MSWKERVRNKIVLSSPDGDEYSAYWAGNERRIEKKLGIFQYPFVKGARVQDLDVGSTSYPLTIFFEGDNHDLEGAEFFESCKQRGVWEIVHPILGTLFLQLVSAGQDLQPVENANITQFSLEFIEPIPETAMVSDEELASLSGNSVDEMNSNSAQSFASKVNAASARGQAAIKSVTNKVLKAVNTVMGTITSVTSAVQTIQDAAQTAIQETMNAVIFAPLAFAGQVKAIIQTPAMAVQDVKSRLSAYETLAEEIFEIENPSVREDGRNTAVVKELFLVSIIGALSTIATTGNSKTRAQVIDTIESIGKMYADIVENLDEHQTQFEDMPIDKQYFSQSETYSDTMNVVMLATRYLLQAIGNLKIERRIFLTESTPPIMIAMREYGGPGLEDENIDFFIETNGLKGDELLILPPAKEVKVYV